MLRYARQCQGLLRIISVWIAYVASHTFDVRDASCHKPRRSKSITVYLEYGCKPIVP